VNVIISLAHNHIRNPNPNVIISLAPNPTRNPNPVPNPTPIPNPNLNISINLNQTKAKPDARAKNYLAIVRKYWCTKTVHLQTEHKYTTKANLCIRVEMADLSMFQYDRAFQFLGPGTVST